MLTVAGLFAPASGRRAALRLLLSVLSLALSACAIQSRPPTSPSDEFRFGEIRFVPSADTVSLRVEIAETPPQRRRGLSRRAGLPHDQGMIFLFAEEQPAGSSFWMYRTSFPLSIAFLDAAMVIREIRDMRPCTSWIPLFCPAFRAAVPFHAALEVNRGYFERYGIGVGTGVALRRSGARPH